jgi:DNA repair exonuclease SbcCD ATPase subunit
MIKLKSLHLKNFRSWSELKLVDIDQLGTVLLVGINGAGKSSIRQAIEYLLLDKTSDDLKLSELPKDAGKNCMIHGEFEKDGVTFSITKYRNSDEFGNATIFEVDGDKSMTATDRRVTQKNISSYLGIDNENTLYSSTIFSLRSPSFPELKESERKPILFDILPLSKYNKYLEKAKNKVEDIKTLLSSFERDKSHYEDALVEELDKLKRNKEEITKYDDLRQEQLKSIELKLSELKVEDLSEIESELAKAKSELAKVKESFDEKTYDTLKKELDKYEKEVYDKSKEIEKLEREKLKRTEQIKFQVSVKEKNNYFEKEDKKEELDKEVKKLEDGFDSEEITKALDSLEKCRTAIQAWDRKIEDIEKEISHLLGSECPILHTFCQELKDNQEEKSKYNRKQLDALNKERDKLKENKKTLESKYNSLTQLSSKIVLLKSDIAKIDTEINSSKNQIEEAEESISKATKESIVLDETIKSEVKLKEDIEKKIIEIRNSIHTFSDIKNKIKDLENKVSQIKSEYKHKLAMNATSKERKKEYESQIKQIRGEENPYKKIERDIKDQVATLKTEIVRIEKEFKENQDLLPYYDFWVRGFGKAGIPNMLCEEFLDSLEYETNMILSSLNGELTVSINSQSERGNKSVSEAISYEVHSPYKKITDYHSFSSGQQQRIKIADIFAFHKLNGYDFLILDELLELSLDEEGVESVVRLIQEKSKEVSTMLVTSHNDRVKDAFNNVFYVEYEGGNSYLRR